MKIKNKKIIKLTSAILTPLSIIGVSYSLIACSSNINESNKILLEQEKNRIDLLNFDLKPNLSQEEIKNINQNNLFDYLINAPINNHDFNYDVVDFKNANNSLSFKIKISKDNESIDSKLFSIDIPKPNPPQPPVVHKPTLINKDISAIKLNLNNNTVDEVLNNNLINPEFIFQHKEQIFMGENNITDSNQIDVHPPKTINKTTIQLSITLKKGSWYDSNGMLSANDSTPLKCNINDFKQPVVPNPDQAQEELDKEVERINNSNIKPKNSTLTQQEFDQIDAANILDNLNLKLFLNDFDYSINPVDFKKENNSISFIIEVGVINSEWIGDPLPKRTKKITVDFIIDNNVVSRIDEVVEKLNKLNLTLSDKKIEGNQITFRDLTWNFLWGPEFILNNISEFNPNDANVRNDFEFKVPQQSFKHDILNQRITFIISVKEKQTNKEKDTVEKSINYTIPNQLIGQIDQLPVDNDVKVSNSYKGTLQKLKTKVQPYNNYLNDEIGSFNHNWKIKEYLYQLRFIFYQSFNDNAKSIDYGIVSYKNNSVTLELKARVRNNANYSTIFQYLESKERQISLKENDIVKITMTKELSNKWEILNKGGDFGELLDKGWSMTNGDFQSISNGSDKKFWIANLGKDWNVNISINNSNLTNIKIDVIRRFPFLFPYKYK